MKTEYDVDFYKQIVAGSRKSANIIVPKVCEIVRPDSVIELGCGMATWSAAFLENGVNDLVAVDGPWVDQNAIQIDKSHFHAHDLRQPLDLGRKFDLAICMEVAEHLPIEMAPKIVAALAAHADTVLFAAAIPYQGGTSHINEQPQSYWAKIFKENGMAAFDAIRAKVWNDKEIEIWYRQNTIIYSKSGLHIPVEPVLDVVHPEMLAYYVSGWRGFARIGRRLLKGER